MSDFDGALGTRLQRLLSAAPGSRAPDLDRVRSPIGRLTAVILAAGLLLIAFIAVVPGLRQVPLATVSVGQIEIAHEAGDSWSGEVSRLAAEEAALAKIHDLDPSVVDLQITSSRQVAGVRTVTDEDGQREFSSTTAVDAWVFEITGDSAEFDNATGWAMVDADNGNVIAADLLQN